MLFIHRNRLSKTVAIFTLICVLASVSGGVRVPSRSDFVDVEVNYSPTCNSDSDCTATIRSSSPQQSHEGVVLCKCYASSSINPFDECEGEADACMSAKCRNTCGGAVAYCSAKSICELRYYEVDLE